MPWFHASIRLRMMIEFDDDEIRLLFNVVLEQRRNILE